MSSKDYLIYMNYSILLLKINKYDEVEGIFKRCNELYAKVPEEDRVFLFFFLRFVLYIVYHVTSPEPLIRICAKPTSPLSILLTFQLHNTYYLATR